MAAYGFSLTRWFVLLFRAASQNREHLRQFVALWGAGREELCGEPDISTVRVEQVNPRASSEVIANVDDLLRIFLAESISDPIMIGVPLILNQIGPGIEAS